MIINVWVDQRIQYSMKDKGSSKQIWKSNYWGRFGILIQSLALCKIQTCLGICGPKTVKGLQPLYLLEKSSNEFTADAGYYITHCNLDQCSLINKDSKITIASGFIVSIKLS